MRQLRVHVRRDRTGQVLRLAERHEVFAPVVVPAQLEEGEEGAVVLLYVPNDHVGDLVREIEREVEEARLVLIPRGVLPIHIPLADVDPRVRRVAARSTLELVLGALQSIGSWKGMLLYAVFSGAIAAYGVVYEVSYLLVAAMLVAPMGAPVMVCAVATAIGDVHMFGRGALRFCTAIAVLTGTAVLLAAALDLTVPNAMMGAVTELSAWTVLLALAGGAAGAQALVQSDRDSLVSGTAAGFLVAVSLTPASAVLGLALWIGQWNYAGAAAFVLLLTFSGVIASGWLLLHLGYHVRPADPTTQRGSDASRNILAAASLLVVAGLVAWQTAGVPVLRKNDRLREATELARSTAVPGAYVLDVSPRFVHPAARPGEVLLVDLVAERTDDALPEDSLAAAIRAAVSGRLAGLPEDTVYVSVTLLP